MRKIFFLLLNLFILSTNAQTQCAFDQLLKSQIESSPEKHSKREIIEQSWNQNINYEALKMVKRNGLTIPVVVHVIHDNGIGNISEAQIIDALRVLNEDFNLKNPDTTELREPFIDYVANAQIEFKLAKTDPNGNCTNGIIRVNDPKNTYNVYSVNPSNPQKASPAWDPYKYLNIWVVNSISSPNSSPGSIIAGYAYLPNEDLNNISDAENNEDKHGIVMRQNYMGTIETANQDGRTLTHEAGHALGLHHTFRDGCVSDCENSGDKVCDTPPASSSAFACNREYNSCPNTPTNSVYENDVKDMIENYMSYHSCQWMFSLGQKNRMYNMINQYMSDITSSNNLNETGVNSPDLICNVDFSTLSKYNCINKEVQFNDESFSGITTWEWDFGENATPQFSNQKNPIIVFNKSGYQNITLKVGDGVSSEQISKAKGVYIFETEELNYFQNFNTPLLEDIQWLTESYQLNNSVGFSDNNSLTLNNFNQEKGLKYNVSTPPFNLTFAENATLRFQYAFAAKSDTNTDALKIELSRNCGDSWSTRETIRLSDLKTTTNVPNTEFTPTDLNEWKLFEMNIPNSFLGNEVLIRLVFQSGGGNNLFIDDFSIESPLSTLEYINASKIKVYPNPSSSSIELQLELT